MGSYKIYTWVGKNIVTHVEGLRTPLITSHQPPSRCGQALMACGQTHDLLKLEMIAIQM